MLVFPCVSIALHLRLPRLRRTHMQYIVADVLSCMMSMFLLITGLQAYTDALRGDVKAVGSSLVCLPEVDAGGLGRWEQGLCWKAPVQEAENDEEARRLALSCILRSPTTTCTAQPAPICPGYTPAPPPMPLNHICAAADAPETHLHCR